MSTRSSTQKRRTRIQDASSRSKDRTGRGDSPEVSEIPVSPESEPEITDPVADAEKGVESGPAIPDIVTEIRSEVDRMQGEQPKKVSFSNFPVTIIPSGKATLDEYDILQDIKEQKANVTIGQLLHDNLNYQKQLKEALSRPRRRKVVLPEISVNLVEQEDRGAPEITVVIDGCSIDRVPVDGGSGVNLMLESTASDLGFTSIEPTH